MICGGFMQLLMSFDTWFSEKKNESGWVVQTLDGSQLCVQNADEASTSIDFVAVRLAAPAV